VVIVFALGAAFANALASICQRLGVEDAPSANGPSVSLVRHMIQRRIWLLGFAVMLLGFVAQTAALHVGALNVVQPLLVSELVMIVLTLRFWFGAPLDHRETWGAVLLSVGLAIFLAAASPTDGSQSPSNAEWLVAMAIVIAGATLFVVMARRGPLWWRALSLGAAASVGFALTAALTKAVSNLIVRGVGPLFSSWPLYALAVIGLGSFLLMQSAFQIGPFTASQSTLILVNPFVSMGIGFVLYGEHLRGGVVFVFLEVLSLIAMVIGALGLSTSTLVANVHDETSDAHLLAGRGRYARWRREQEESLI